MHKRHNIGSSIVENCIIIGLVGLTSIGILTTFGGTIHEVMAGCHFKFKEFQPFGKSANAVTNEEQGTTDPIVVDPLDPGVIPPGAGVTPINPGVIPQIDSPEGSPITAIPDPVVPITPGINPGTNAFSTSH